MFYTTLSFFSNIINHYMVTKLRIGVNWSMSGLEWWLWGFASTHGQKRVSWACVSPILAHWARSMCFREFFEVLQGGLASLEAKLVN